MIVKENCGPGLGANRELGVIAHLGYSIERLGVEVERARVLRTPGSAWQQSGSLTLAASRSIE